MFDDSSTDECRVIIAQNLKGLRADCGLTQAQLAEAAHVEIQTYQRYEYADINIPMSKAIRITAALGCTLDELLTPTGTRIAPPFSQPRRLGKWIEQRVLKTLRRPSAKSAPK